MWKEKEECRICDGGFVEVLDLGFLYPSEFVDEVNEQVKVPLTLVRCDTCNLVQLKHTVDRDKMYRQYWYQSGLNKSMVESLRDVVESVEQRVDLGTSDVVVDIGCNDGTLFDLYSKRNIVKVGFDPAKNLADEAERRCSYFINDYFNADKYRQLKLSKARVITSIAMFYDLDDPHSFIDDVVSILADDGIWVIQMTDLISMLKTNAFDNICHEHLEYYSLHVLKALLEQHGLTIFDVEYNDVNGGSVRVYVELQSDLSWHDIDLALDAEDDYMRQFDDPFEAFNQRIQEIKAKINWFVNLVVYNESVIAVFGASTKGNTLLQYFGLDWKLISHAAEINKDKFGKKTIGTNIPIISEKDSLRSRPDYYLVLPWHFIDNFIERNKRYLRAGGKFIVPMPYPVLYSYDGKEPL